MPVAQSKRLVVIAFDVKNRVPDGGSKNPHRIHLMRMWGKLSRGSQTKVTCCGDLRPIHGQAAVERHHVCGVAVNNDTGGDDTSQVGAGAEVSTDVRLDRLLHRQRNVYATTSAQACMVQNVDT